MIQEQIRRVNMELASISDFAIHRETRSRLLHARPFYGAANLTDAPRRARSFTTDREMEQVRCAILPRGVVSRQSLRERRRLRGTPHARDSVPRARTFDFRQGDHQPAGFSLGSAKLSWQSRVNLIRKSDYTNAITSRNIASKVHEAKLDAVEADLDACEQVPSRLSEQRERERERERERLVS